MFGVDPMDIGTHGTLWYQWQFYRAGKVTEFVRKVGLLCRSNGITITAVIFPNRELALNTKLQDWKTWSVNNFVDGFTPLFLTCDEKTASNLIEEVLRNKSAATDMYAGLFVTFMNGSDTDLIKQIHASRKYNLNGIIIFDYAHFGSNYVNVLTQSVLKSNSREILIDGTEYNKPEKIMQYKSKGNRRGR